jgi:hypothetical protein
VNAPASFTACGIDRSNLRLQEDINAMVLAALESYYRTYGHTSIDWRIWIEDNPDVMPPRWVRK